MFYLHPSFGKIFEKFPKLCYVGHYFVVLFFHFFFALIKSLGKIKFRFLIKLKVEKDV